jgi:hypothetical protein
VQLAWRAARSVAPRGPAGLIDAVHGKRILGKVDTNEDNGQTSVHSELMSKPHSSIGYPQQFDWRPVDKSGA